jgi:glyoxylase-like metal-dependent hydrolase (beta-lactamase superfamily II)
MKTQLTGAATLLVLLSVAGACGRHSAQPAFTLKQVGPTVWAAIDNPQAQPSSGANAGFLTGHDGVLVIDTFDALFNADAARALLADIRRRTKLPVRFVVNTHYHLDHVGGNGIFAEAGALILGQRNVRDWIHAENLRLMTEGMAAQHQTISPEQPAFIEGLVAPTAVYDDGLDLHVGARHVLVRSLPGHTGSDSVVVLPDDKIVFAGDLFWHDTTPNTIDATTSVWVETLTGLARDYSDYVFVPGHGDVGKAQDVVALRDYLVALRQSVAAAQAQGKAGSAVTDAVLPGLTARYGKWAYFKD